MATRKPPADTGDVIIESLDTPEVVETLQREVDELRAKVAAPPKPTSRLAAAREAYAAAGDYAHASAHRHGLLLEALTLLALDAAEARQ